MISVNIWYEYSVQQIVSLAQLLMDPYYRTMDGFQVCLQRNPFSSHDTLSVCLSVSGTRTEGVVVVWSSISITQFSQQRFKNKRRFSDISAVDRLCLAGKYLQKYFQVFHIVYLLCHLEQLLMVLRYYNRWGMSNITELVRLQFCFHSRNNIAGIKIN